jgi:methyl-accepting chemotaxis protein
MSEAESAAPGEESGDDSGGGSAGVLGTITPNFIRRSFALKFGIVLILLGLAVGAVGFLGSEQVKTEFEEEVNEKFATLAQQNSNALRDWNANNIDTLQTYARSPAVNSGSPSDVSQFLQTEKRLRRDWGGTSGTPHLHVVDTSDGTIVSSTSGLYTGQTAADLNQTLNNAVATLNSGSGTVRTDAFRENVADEVQIGYATVLPDRPNQVLIYTVPVRDYGTSLSSGGVFGESGTRGVAMVVDGNGRIIFEQYNNEDQFLRAYPDNGVLETLSREDSDIGPGTPGSMVAGPTGGALAENDDTYDLAGKEYVVGVGEVGPVQGREAPGWTVLIHTNTQDAYGEVQSVANQALLATGIGVLLIGLFGAVLGRNTARAIDRLTGKAEEMEDGNLDVDLESGRIDNIGRLYDGFDNMRNALQQQIQEAEQARKEAEVSRAEAMEMSSYLQETADEYAEIMQQCAAGDLTQRMDADGENEAMDRIAGEFNEMIDELEKTTGQLKSFSDEVETASDVVKTSSESVRDASEQVADSVQKISDDAYDQKERLQTISETMDEIATDLEAFAAENDVDFGDSLERIEEIANMLNEVVDLSEETMAESENVAGAAEEQAAELNEVTQRAEDLSRYARPLREVLDRFETESEHEFYFPTGPGSGEGTMPDEGED